MRRFLVNYRLRIEKVDRIAFKKVFHKVVKHYSFSRFKSKDWFSESTDRILLLDLQKSNYSELYYLNISIYINGAFGNYNIDDNSLIVKGMSEILMKQPTKFNPIFDLENELEDRDREEGLNELFSKFIIPLINNTKTYQGIISYMDELGIKILSPVKDELDKLSAST